MRDVADLVEEERALVRQLEEALLGVDRARERPLDVAEQVGLQEIGGQAARVHHHERLVHPWRVGVDGLGRQLLAGAALSHHEYGGAGRGGLGDELEDLLHARALAHDLREAPLVLEGGAQGPVLVEQAPLLQGVAQDVQHFLVLEGLGHVVEGALLHGRDGGLHRGVGGDHEHHQVAVGLLELVQHREAAHLRQHDVHDGGVEAALAGQGQALGTVLGQGDGVARLAQKGAEDVAHDLLVVDDEDALRLVAQGEGRGGHGAHWRAASASTRAGRATWKLVPLPGVESTKMAPPCSCTIP